MYVCSGRSPSRLDRQLVRRGGLDSPSSCVPWRKTQAAAISRALVAVVGDDEDGGDDNDDDANDDEDDDDDDNDDNNYDDDDDDDDAHWQAAKPQPAGRVARPRGDRPPMALVRVRRRWRRLR